MKSEGTESDTMNSEGGKSDIKKSEGGKSGEQHGAVGGFSFEAPKFSGGRCSGWVLWYMLERFSHFSFFS